MRTLLALVLLAASAAAEAQQVAIVERNVNLRRDPSSNHPPVMLVLPPEELELLDSAKVNNYFRVFRAESQDTGWVWGSNVRIADATSPASSTLTSAPAATVDPNWAKPTAVVSAFQSPVDNQSCGPNGDGGDTLTNHLKNRTDVPATYHAVTFAAIGDLPYPVGPQQRTAWNADSVARVTRLEGVPVQVAGYLVAIKPQNGGGGESVNCHMTATSETDWHMAIVENPGQGENESVVVEPTPRSRAGHPRWTVSRIGPWVDSTNPVRISGWLMFDPAHRNHLTKYRKTLWEIHPVTRIEVWQQGAWVNLDDLP